MPNHIDVKFIELKREIADLKGRLDKLETNHGTKPDQIKRKAGRPRNEDRSFREKERSIPSPETVLGLAREAGL